MKGIITSIEACCRLLNGTLHLLKHRFEHLSRRGVDQHFGLVDYFLVDSLSRQEFGCLIREIVTVVLNYIILLWFIFRVNVFQKVLKELLWDLRVSEILFFDWLSIRCLFWMVITDSSSEIIFSAKDNQGRMIDSIDLLSNHHHAKPLGHSLRDIIESQYNLLTHFS
jgi:hypothetical protein